MLDLTGNTTELVEVENEEEDKWLERKAAVDDFVEEAVESCECYAAVKEGVTAINHTLDFREEQYIQNKYVICWQERFFKELETVLLSREWQNNGLSDLVKNIDQISDIEKVYNQFRDLRFSSLFPECKAMMSKHEVAMFVKKVNAICCEQLRLSIERYSYEKLFISELEVYFKTYFLEMGTTKEALGKEIKSYSTGLKVLREILQFLSKENSQRTKALKDVANSVSVDNCSEKFIETVKVMVQSYLAETTVEKTNDNGNTIVTFSGRYVDFNDIMTQVSNMNSEINEVHVLAEKLLLVYTSVKWPGKNVVLMSPEIVVECQAELDVSGKDGVSGFSLDRAADGADDGADGEAGLHGSHGESGGNVLIVADHIHKPENLFIRSNGGTGTNGQIGGNGRDGKNGKDGDCMTNSEFETYLQEFRFMYGLGMKDVTHPIYDVTYFSYRLPLQELVLIQGKDGTSGQKGGDGGEGGDAGQGGYAGCVEALFMTSDGEHDLRVENRDGRDGLRGADGAGGQGGRNGRRGTDHARVDPNFPFREFRYYHGNLAIGYESKASPDNAWCSERQEYAKIIKYNDQATTYGANGTKGKNMIRKQSQQRTNCVRKRALSKEILCNQYMNRFIGNVELYVDYFPQIDLQIDHTVNINQKISMSSTGIQVRERHLNPAVLAYIPASSRQTSHQHLRQGLCGSAKEFTNWKQTAEEIMTQLAKLQTYVISASLSATEIMQINTELWKLHSKRLPVKYSSNNEIKQKCKDIENYLTDKYKAAKLQILATTVREQEYRQTVLLTRSSREYLSQAVLNTQRLETFKEIDEYIHYSEMTFHLDGDRQEPEPLATSTHETSFEDSNNMEDCSLDETDDEYFTDSDEDSSDTEAYYSADEAITDFKVYDETYLIQQSYFDQEIDRLVQDLTGTCSSNIQKCLKKIRYLPYNDTLDLLHILCNRLQVEGLQVQEEALQWLICCILEDDEAWTVADFIILFGMHSQQQWMSEFLFMQACKLFQDTRQVTHRLLSLRKEITEKYASHQILLFLSQRLSVMDKHDIESTDILADVQQILDLSECIAIDETVMTSLDNTSICDWKYKLRWFSYLVKIQCLKTEQAWEDSAVLEAAYHVSVIENKYGEDFVNIIFNELNSEQSELCIQSFQALLKQISTSKFLLDESAKNILSKHPFSEWSTRIADECVQDRDRTVEDLVRLMDCDGNNSVDSKILQNCKSIVDSITKYQNENIKNYTQNDIRCWCSKFKEQNMQTNLPEVLAVINQAVYLTKHYHMRDTQKLSVVLFLNNPNSGMLQQIATGEGKSLIIATLAIIQALQGENVDIITSSPVLAVRDAELFADLYAVFGLTAGHNTSELSSSRKDAYTKNKMVYGTISAFQRDILLDDFYSAGVGISSRRRGYIIVDEVDSLLLDKGQNLLILSHQIPNMDSLEAVFVYIWNFVHSRDGRYGTEDDVQGIRAEMIDMMYGIIRKTDLHYLLPESTLRVSLWEKMVEVGMLGCDGRILIRKDIEEYSLTGSNQSLEQRIEKLDLAANEKDVLLCFLKDKVRQGIHLPVPKHLADFIDLHLDVWIENAFLAKYMTQNDQYIIDSDRSDAAASLSPNIIIMDKDTGVEQYHSQWNNGLHQFLQLKHGTRLSSEGLRAIYISNVAFFTKYEQKLYGLSGTLGSKRERDMLKTLYNTEYAIIPSFCPSQFTEEMAMVCSTEKEWKAYIVKTAEGISQTRPVLVICESVQDVEKLEKTFKCHNMYVYKHSYEPLELGTEKQIDHGCIILATNLAGRGTDIQISERVSQLGGLHVCLTYLPSNVRVEEQAFGRSGRKGQKGTGQIVCVTNVQDDQPNTTDIANIVLMKIKRNQQEEENLNNLLDLYHTEIKVEERYFEKFQAIYKSIRSALNDAWHEKNDKDKKDVILESCLNQWAFCLDKAICQSQGQTKADIIESYLKKLKNVFHYMKSDICHCFDLVKEPAIKVKLAKIFIEEKKFSQATELLDDVIEEEDNFSEAAHYYKCHCIVKEHGIQTEHHKNKFLYHLQRAYTFFKKRCNTLSSLAAFISMTAKTYGGKRESFLFCDDYKKQKEDMVHILQIFMKSILDITGHTVSPDVLESCGLNPVTALEIHQCLLDSGVLIKHQIAENIPDQIYQELQQQYQLYYKDLIGIIKENCNRDVTAETFQYILPSREELWELLVKALMLSDERCYVLLNKKRLEQETSLTGVYDGMVKEMLDIEGIDFDITVSDDGSLQSAVYRRVCLHPEHLDAIASREVTAIPKERFIEPFHNTAFYKILKSNEIVSETRTGVLNCQNGEKLSKYDGLHCESFMEICGISRDMSHEIFQELKGVDHGNISEYVSKLKSHTKYRSEIESVAAKHFTYRAALHELMTTGNISLDSNPHEQLFSDLLLQNIIEQVKVSEIAEVESTIADITKKYYPKSAKVIKESQKPSWKGMLGNVMKRTLETANYVANAILPGTNKEIKSTVKSITTTLDNLKSGLMKTVTKMSYLKDLESICDMNNGKCEEVQSCQTNGLGHILTLQEERWTGTAIGKMFAIFILGLAQIALGVAIEIFTTGFGTHVAAAFLSEGCGDIIFAIQCAFSGYCTWASYWENKKISLCLTAVTSAVGGFLSRGAQFSKYGYKIGGHYMQELAGWELLQAAGKRAVIKKAAISIGKNLLQAGATGTINGIIDKLYSDKLHGFFQQVSQKIMETINTQFEALRVNMTKLCRKVGIANAEIILFNFKAHCNERTAMVGNISSGITSLGNSVISGISAALNKKYQSGQGIASAVSRVSKVANGVMAYAKYAKVVNGIIDFIRLLPINKMKDLEQMVDAARKDAEPKVANEDIEEMCDKAVNEWKEDVSMQITIHIEQVVKQLLRKGVHMMVDAASRQMKKQYQQHKTFQLRKEMEKYKKEYENNMQNTKNYSEKASTTQEHCTLKYHENLLQLLKETRDPQLYADLIREGAPIDILGIQATANIIGPIIIRQSQKVLPSQINPNQHLGQDQNTPVNVAFQTAGRDQIGHFTPHENAPENTSETNQQGDCFLAAVSQQYENPLTRQQIAHQIETDPMIRKYIAMGIHEHYIGAGAAGGFSRTSVQESRINSVMNELKTIWQSKQKTDKEIQSFLEKVQITAPYLLEENTKNDDLMQAVYAAKQLLETKKASQELLDEAETLICDKSKIDRQIGEVRNKLRDSTGKVPGCQATGKVRGTGNHELFQLGHIEDWLERGFEDLVLHIRLGTEHMLFENEGILSGHAGALYKKNKRNSSVSKGQKEFHQKCTEMILPSKNKKEALQNALYANLCNRVHPNTLASLDMDNIITARGYVLSDPVQRDQFILDYSLDYQRTFLAAKAVGVDEGRLNTIQPLSDDIKNHPNIKRVEKGMAQLLQKQNKSQSKFGSKFIAALGGILMEPIIRYK